MATKMINYKNYFGLMAVTMLILFSAVVMAILAPSGLRVVSAQDEVNGISGEEIDPNALYTFSYIFPVKNNKQIVVAFVGKYPTGGNMLLGTSGSGFCKNVEIRVSDLTPTQDISLVLSDTVLYYQKGDMPLTTFRTNILILIAAVYGAPQIDKSDYLEALVEKRAEEISWQSWLGK